jgi:hypothetical protein
MLFARARVELLELDKELIQLLRFDPRARIRDLDAEALRPFGIDEDRHLSVVWRELDRV